mmetsp:Transcript_134670/g.268795  ORF Transcript_134670/g.268795 Transcript_134670/m.268795 type:complete len:117 (-) Transcript_134670:69-419(-)
MLRVLPFIAFFARSMSQILRSVPGATAMAAEASPWDSAPRAAPGGIAASVFIILVPAVLLFVMYCAKKEGGLYPNFCVCFIVMVLFTYTMILSPQTYTCIADLEAYLEVLGNYTKK